MSRAKNPKHLRGRRKCIFCEGDGKMSKEHVFALWLREFFPRDAQTKHKSAFISWPDEASPSAPIDIRKPGQGHVGSKKLRVVCEPCNNEWLSGLETKAQHAIPPLIVGNRYNLLEGGQALLATWAAKTAMVAEHFKPTDAGITQGERTWLMNSLTPPEKWFIWIAPYKGRDWGNLSIYQSRIGLSPTPVARPSEAPYYAQATTFGLGHILFCVVSGSDPNMGRHFAGREADGLVQIWPAQVRSILWPPARIFGDREAYQLANIFSLSGIFDDSFDPGANWAFAH